MTKVFHISFDVNNKNELFGYFRNGEAKVVTNSYHDSLEWAADEAFHKVYLIIANGLIPKPNYIYVNRVILHKSIFSDSYVEAIITIWNLGEELPENDNRCRYEMVEEAVKMAELME